jgi:hypothetical protein
VMIEGCDGISVNMFEKSSCLILLVQSVLAVVEEGR